MLVEPSLPVPNGLRTLSALLRGTSNALERLKLGPLAADKQGRPFSACNLPKHHKIPGLISIADFAVGTLS
jgi:hypothetical protein